MVKVVLILLYLWQEPKGQPVLKLERIPTSNQTECQAQALGKTKELIKDPRFEKGLYIGCLELSIEEAKK